MSDGSALLRAICENPADDTARLVYADWLEEQDDGVHGPRPRLKVYRGTGGGLTQGREDVEIKDADGDTLLMKGVGGFGEPMLMVRVTQEGEEANVNLTREQARKLAEWLLEWFELRGKKP